MKKTPFYLLVAACLLQIVAATANYYSTAKPIGSSALAYDLTSWLHDNAQSIIFWTAGLSALVALISDLPGIVGYRRTKANDMLDQFAEMNWSSGRGTNRNRVTLFRVVPGWKAYMTGLWRLRWRVWRRRHKLKSVNRIELGADYLQVYARSSDSRTRRSCAAFRIADKAEDGEGIVGSVWLNRLCKELDLPKLKPGSLRNVGDVTKLPPTDSRRIYVERINVRDPILLDAMDTYSRHFLGSTVLVRGKKWGVLLIDSDEDSCPFAGRQKPVERSFRELAIQLSHVLD